MNPARLVVLIFSLTATASLAQQTNALPTKITVGGVTYENVQWGAVSPYAVTITHKTGVAKIPLAKLPADVQKRYEYNPQKATDYRALETVADAKARAAAAERARQYHERRKAETLESVEHIRRWDQEREAQEQAERQAKDAQSSPPAIQIKRFDVYNIRPTADGSYSANIVTEGNTVQLITFAEAGLSYFRRHRIGTVYGIVREAKVINQFGAQASDTAISVIGSQEFRNISGQVSYHW